VLALALTAAHQLLKAGWFVSRPRTLGAHALALTPERKLILVRLRYARGWRLPGGGRNPGEDPVEAALRELREEIGMTSHGAVELAAQFEQRPDGRSDLVSVIVVEDVCYAPSWSWEIERIIEADPRSLPRDLAPITSEWIKAVLPRLEARCPG
jgi:8-oxo-dGTP pyrophosphatase MutT (NUDIX family)